VHLLVLNLYCTTIIRQCLLISMPTSHNSRRGIFFRMAYDALAFREAQRQILSGLADKDSTTQREVATQRDVRAHLARMKNRPWRYMVMQDFYSCASVDESGNDVLSFLTERSRCPRVWPYARTAVYSEDLGRSLNANILLHPNGQSSVCTPVSKGWIWSGEPQTQLTILCLG
jgi:hypothetical protein